MRYLPLAMAAAALLVVGGTAHASPIASSSHQSLSSFTGRIEAIDLEHLTFIVRNTDHGKLREMQFHVAPHTWITTEDRDIGTLGNLQIGEDVTVQYRTPPTKR